jgi:hypothetical protein
MRHLSKWHKAAVISVLIGCTSGCADNVLSESEPLSDYLGGPGLMQEDSVAWDSNGVLEVLAQDTVFKWVRTASGGNWNEIDHYEDGVLQGTLQLTHNSSGAVVAARYVSTEGWWAETNADATGTVVTTNFEGGGCDPQSDPECEEPEFMSSGCEIEQALAEGAMKDFEMGLGFFAVAAAVPFLTVPGAVMSISGGIRAIRATRAWAACLEAAT